MWGARGAMDKWTCYIIFVLLWVLVLTQSIYIDYVEMIAIVVALSFIAIVKNRQMLEHPLLISNPCAIGFLYWWIFGLMDVAIDHVVHFNRQEQADEQSLSLSQKIIEFGDDLFIGSLMSMVLVLVISLLGTMLWKSWRGRLYKGEESQ